MSKRDMLFLFLFFFLLVLLLLSPIHLITSDLGRHLTNGKIVFSTSDVLYHNLYSYTNTNFPFINHHWFSGVVLYSVQKIAGFAGLSLFSLFLNIAVFLVFFLIAKEESSPKLALLPSYLIMPLIVRRAELRPELFSYLLTGVFLFILLKEQKTATNRFLFLLPLLMILWVNLHIYFFLGEFLVGVFVLKQVLNRDRLEKKKLLLIFALTILATLLNPNGLRGALYPFFIFQNYGYALSENASILQTIARGGLQAILPYLIVLTLLFVSYIAVFLKKKTGNAELLALAILTTILSLSSIRNIELFGYTALIALASNLFLLRPNVTTLLRSLYVGCCISGFFILIMLSQLITGQKVLGLGLDSTSKEALTFLQTHTLKGPIFNDYDIGGFLIYSLYPKQKVFVDNRPEAYPAAFFKNIYIPMQLGGKWNEEDVKYHFRTIIFSEQDQSVWARTFLFRRLHDPAWIVSFDDGDMLILTRRQDF